MIKYVIYARYSDDKQSPDSIEDQKRKCREYAAQKGFVEVRTYEDAAISAAGMDRKAFQRLMVDAASKLRDFDLLLIDDTSRLSRSMASAMGLHEQLAHYGVRVIAVSQGIDTDHEQSDVMLAVHSITDSLFLKEVGKKTHRGLEGKILRGFSAGGRCYGYDSFDAEGGGHRWKINEAEAAIICEIFDWSASGYSLKRIAGLLNARKTPPPQKREGRAHSTWCPTAIRAMLRRELYIGRRIWNQTRFVKTPRTNKRIARPRPRNEWQIQDMPELRIISDELWTRVQTRQERLKQIYAQSGGKAVSRAASSPYLFSGFLTCGACGAKLIIVSGHNRGGAKYGCPQRWNRNACSNANTVKSRELEIRLIERLQEAVNTPEVIDVLVAKLLRAQDRKEHANENEKREREVKSQLDRLIVAIAEVGHSDALLKALHDREAELRELSLSKTDDKPLKAEEIRVFVTNSVCDISALFAKNPVLAKTKLAKHVDLIRMLPQADGSYIAESEWDLTGAGGPVMVAGARFELATFGL